MKYNDPLWWKAGYVVVMAIGFVVAVVGSIWGLWALDTALRVLRGG